MGKGPPPLTESSQVGHIKSEHFQRRILNLLHPLKAREEGAPELVPAILAVVDGMEAQIKLRLDDLIDSLVLDAVQFLVIGNDLPVWKSVAARVASDE